MDLTIEPVDFMNDRTAFEERTLEAYAVFDTSGSPVFLSMDYAACEAFLAGES